MGAHKAVKDGQEGVYFAVWAPHAKDIFVVGDFNDWKAYGYDMKPVSDGGIYELFIPGAKVGQMYKFLIVTPQEKQFIKQTCMPMKPSFARTMHLLLRI